MIGSLGLSNRNRPKSSRPPILLTVLIGTGLALLVSAASLLSLQHSEHASARARAATNAVVDMTAYFQQLTDAETGQRGHLLTLDAAYLNRYIAAVPQVEAIGRKLTQHIAVRDAAPDAHSELLKEIERKTKQKLAELDAAVQLQKLGRIDQALAMVKSDEGTNLMDTIRGMVKEFVEAEREMLETQRSKRRASSLWSTLSAVGGTIMLATVIAIMGRRIAMNLKERDRAEMESAEAEAKLRTTLASIADGLIATDQRGMIIFMNANAQTMLGSRPANSIGRHITEVFSPQDVDTGEPVVGWFAAVLSHGVTRPQRDTVVGVLTNAGLKPVEHSMSPIIAEDQTFLGWVLAFRDVMHRISAERERESLLASERAARAQSDRMGRMKDEFLATLSHELRTPLNAILGWTQILRRPACDAPTREQGLEIIERNTRQQSRLIADLLDVSRMISGKLRLELAPTDLSLVIREAVNSVKPSADAREIILREDIYPLSETMIADPHRIEQVVWNLLTNAIKFTARGGIITVQLTRSTNQATIRVTDTGEGIASEFLPHVFDRFRQADSSTTRSYGGLGLGLAIVKQIVDLHGGMVKAESAGPGKGSIFTVVLPFRAPPRSIGASDLFWEEAEDDPAPTLRHVEVVVVDDEEDTRNLIAHVLRDAGAWVLIAADADEALALLAGMKQSDRRRVLVSDIGMPRKDGFALIREVRKHHQPAIATVPALALTAFARIEDQHRSIAAGFDAHVPKPVDIVKLTAAVLRLATLRMHPAGADASSLPRERNGGIK